MKQYKNSLLHLTVILVACLNGCVAAIPQDWHVDRSIGSFDRHGLADQERAEMVRKHSCLRPEDKTANGWFEYDIDVPGDGWCVLSGEPLLTRAEYYLDGKLFSTGGCKQINLFLTQGKHQLRIQRYIWWGVRPDMKGFSLQASEAQPLKRIGIKYSDFGDLVLRKGETVDMELSLDSQVAPFSLTAELYDQANNRVVSSENVEWGKWGGSTKLVKLACPIAGEFQTRFLAGKNVVSPDMLSCRKVCVVDTTPVVRDDREMKKELVEEIDCVTRQPDYVSGGDTRIVKTNFGSYRESGTVGFLRAQHQKKPSSWFAYTLKLPEKHVPYVIEVEYPDDAFRTFFVALREENAGAYPSTSGADTGGCYPVSNSMKTFSLFFWPRSKNPRLVVLSPHMGFRSAVSKIRVYKVAGGDEGIPPMKVTAKDGRDYVCWYEEGRNYAGSFGTSGKNGRGGWAGKMDVADRWCRAFSYMGGDSLMPTVSVYQMAMYPSRYNRQFCDPGTPDIVRLLLLTCERYQMKFIPQFHPECREVEELGTKNGKRSNGLWSRDGKVSSWRARGSVLNPIHPIDRAWVKGMVTEFAERYKDSQAFQGVCIRLMGWANPTMNNFRSLDWGYGDYTISQFEKDTGIEVPVAQDDEKRFQKRYDWLMANAKDKWIDWRCDKLVEVHRDLAEALVRIRPDLKLYIGFWGEFGKDTGIDVEKLEKVPGIVFVNAIGGYGRRNRTYLGHLADQAMRDGLLDESRFEQARKSNKGLGAKTISGHQYFEGIGRVAAPANLGMSPKAKTKWVSGVVTPVGRHNLERYALALAGGDATMIGDGGNNYCIGQPNIRGFMKEYRSIPNVGFSPREDARDPVAVWELKRDDGFYFYAVNRERYPVTVKLSLSGQGTVRRIVSSKECGAGGQELTVALKPYELQAFKADKGVAIAGVSETIPAEAQKYVESLVSFLKDLQAKKRDKLSEKGKQVLDKLVKESSRALNEGHYWRARTVVEHHQAAKEVYAPLNAYPPGLQYLDGKTPEDR